jgi:antitoxin VapB
MRVLKLIRIGRSQLLRLPSGYHFEGSEEYIRRDPVSGDLILSQKRGSWAEFFELTKGLKVPDDFLPDRRSGENLSM